MNATHAWACINRHCNSPPYEVFTTRRRAIEHEVWLFGEVDAPPNYSGPCPWLHLDPHEVSKAWRRLKRNYGARAVRVVISVHSRFERDARGETS